MPRWPLLLLVGAVPIAACSASGDDGATSSGQGAASSGGTGGAAGTGGTGGLGVGQGGGTGGSESCAGETYPTDLQPLDLYVLLDQSASMDQPGKWSAVVGAISSFAADPSTAGIGMGLSYFPLPPEHPPPAPCDGSNPNDPACGLYGPCLGSNNCYGALLGDSCNPDDYALPEIAITPLSPAAATAIDDSLTAHTPPAGASTPSEPAMRSALAYASDWAQNNPSHATVLIFATDGEPTNCTTNSIQGIAQHVAAALPAVKTFVVGVGSSLGSLDAIAMAGGTGEALLVDTAADVTQQFIAAMNVVRAQGQCQLAIPDPRTGTPDYGKVNVSIVDPADETMSTTVPNVGSEADCDAGGGWYYDDPQSPARILLCPASCTELTSKAWDVEVLLGCETIVK